MIYDAPAWLESPQLELLTGFRFDWKLDPDEPARALDEVSHTITEEYWRRVKARQRAEVRESEVARGKNRLANRRLLPPPATNWLKIACYSTILCCLHWEILDDLEERAVRLGRLKRGPKSDLAFRASLMGLFAHVEPETVAARKARAPSKIPGFPDDKDRARLAQDMWWAYRHYVEPGEFLQFTRENRSRLARLRSYDEVLPDFHDQIALRRAELDHCSPTAYYLREVYPAELEAVAEKHIVRLSDERHAARLKAEAEEDDDDWDFGR